MFISKKRYNEIMKEREDALDLAKRTLEANGRLLEQQDDALKLCQEVNDDNKRLVNELEESKKKLKEAEVETVKKIFADLYAAADASYDKHTVWKSQIDEFAKKYKVED